MLDFNDLHNNKDKRDLFKDKKIIMKDEIYQFTLAIPKTEETMITIYFEDLLGNSYNQRILFNHFDCLIQKPILISESNFMQ